MNISTGTGTLVHEIVHAFRPANFPDCPAWFNEGLASLYEQCGERKGRITGFPNWRLPKLQEVIRSGQAARFRQFTAMSSDEFHGRKKGKDYNEQYAQARYLCYFLQEQRLLGKFTRSSPPKPRPIQPAISLCKEFSESPTCRLSRRSGNCSF